MTGIEKDNYRLKQKQVKALEIIADQLERLNDNLEKKGLPTAEDPMPEGREEIRERLKSML